VPELDRLGHHVITMDLPVDDVDAGLMDYARVVADAIRQVAGPVVLVGHSMAGMVVPVVPVLHPVNAIIYLCATFPAWIAPAEPGGGIPSMLSIPSEVMVPDDKGRVVMSPVAARRYFFHDYPDDVTQWAVARLRPQALAFLSEQPPVSDRPQVPSAFILCTDDRSVDAQWARWTAAEHLETVPFELPGGHSPFLSRPSM
jgi:pimeloyl-ACP methyl ester carboxylesterase